MACLYFFKYGAENLKCLHPRKGRLLIFRNSSFGKTEGTETEFRVLELYPAFSKTAKKMERRRFQDAQVLPPREKRLPIDVDWPSVWPTAKTFRPSVVPLPIYQGYDQKRAPPGKYANAEIMKIPNFLHLTPPAIKRHCASIKKFCNKWPEGLETDKDFEENFPVEIIDTDYCNSSPTIHDERSRIVTLKVNMRALNLDYHGRDKLIRLLKDHANYNKNTLEINLVADRCPTRKQNTDYLYYLLTALHHESSVKELWEHEKTEADMEKLFFEDSRIQNKMVLTIKAMKDKNGEQLSEENIKESPEVVSYGKAIEELVNEKEDSTSIQNYKQSVLNALGLTQ